MRTLLVLGLIQLAFSDVFSLRYAKLSITEVRAGASVTMTQLAALTLSYNSTALVAVTITNPGGSNPPGEQPRNLDSNINSKWLDFNFYLNKKSDAILDYGHEVQANGYSLTTANDYPERDPVSWKLYGSVDGVSWTMLDVQADYNTPLDRYSTISLLPFHIPVCFVTMSGTNSDGTGWSCDVVSGDYNYHTWEALGCAHATPKHLQVQGDQCKAVFYQNRDYTGVSCTFAEGMYENTTISNECGGETTLSMGKIYKQSCTLSAVGGDGEVCTIGGPAQWRAEELYQLGCTPYGIQSATLTGDSSCTAVLFGHSTFTGVQCSSGLGAVDLTNCPSNLASTILSLGPAPVPPCSVTLIGPVRDLMEPWECTLLGPDNYDFWDLQVSECGTTAQRVNVSGANCVAILYDKGDLKGQECWLGPGYYDPIQLRDLGCAVSDTNSVEIFQGALDYSQNTECRAELWVDDHSGWQCLFGAGNYSADEVQAKGCPSYKSIRVVGGTDCYATLGTSSSGACPRPQGSYVSTCFSCGYTNTSSSCGLTCSCYSIRGQAVSSTVDVRACSNPSNIQNINGFLTCDISVASCVVPEGDYNSQEMLSLGCPLQGTALTVHRGSSQECILKVWTGDFTGTECLFEGVGNFPFSKWSAQGCPNDLAASVSILGDGCRVILYKEGDFTGQSCELGTGDYHTRDFLSAGCPSNSVSSAKILTGPCYSSYPSYTLNGTLGTTRYLDLVQAEDSCQGNSACSGVSRDKLSGSYVLKSGTLLAPSRVEDTFLKCAVRPTIIGDGVCSLTVWAGDNQQGASCQLQGGGQFGYWQWLASHCPTSVKSATVTGAGCVATLWELGDFQGGSCQLQEGIYSSAQLTEEECPQNMINSATAIAEDVVVSSDSCLVTLWEGDRSGFSCNFGPGRFTIADWAETGCTNDAATSARVIGQGCVAVLYDDGDFSGSSCQLPEGTFSTAAFTAMGCTLATTSSVRVYNASFVIPTLPPTMPPVIQPGECRVIISGPANGGWNCSLYGPAQFDSWSWASRGCKNDDANSVSVEGQGCYVTLYDNIDLSGGSCVATEGSYNPTEFAQTLDCPTNAVSAAVIQIGAVNTTTPGSGCILTVWAGEHSGTQCQYTGEGMFHSTCTMTTLRLQGPSDCAAASYYNLAWNKNRACVVLPGDYHSGPLDLMGCAPGNVFDYKIIRGRAPGPLSYPQLTSRLLLDQPIVPSIPDISGRVDSWTVTPPLPLGLGIKNGTIWGTPKVITPTTSYTVQASDMIGRVSTTTFILSVVEQGPLTLRYGQAPSQFVPLGAKVDIFPTITGGTTAMNWSVSPHLPNDLYIAPDGHIRGNAKQTMRSTNFTITATNSGGSATTYLELTIEEVGSESETSDGGGLSTGGAIGIAIAVLVVLAAFIGCFCYRRKRLQRVVEVATDDMSRSEVGGVEMR